MIISAHRFFCLAVSFTLLVSCENLPETKSGVGINFIRLGNGVSPIHGEVISLDMTYSTDDGNVLFDTRKVGAPVKIMFDTTEWRNGGMLYEVLELLEIGDSVQFEIPAENLYEVSFEQELPDSVERGSDILFNLSLVEIISQEELRIEREAELAKLETKLLDNYLVENRIDALTTESGLRYTIHKDGSGPLPKTGEIVVVHFKGYLLNGNVFDSSLEGDPYTFHLGYGRVIKGWDEGIAMFNKGTKATLYLPSALGYGEIGSGRDIPPNSILIFEVEIMDIKPPGSDY